MRVVFDETSSKNKGTIKIRGYKQVCRFPAAFHSMVCIQKEHFKRILKLPIRHTTLESIPSPNLYSHEY